MLDKVARLARFRKKLDTTVCEEKDGNILVTYKN